MPVEHHPGLQWRHSKRSQHTSQRTVELHHLFKQNRWRNTRLVDGPGLAIKAVLLIFHCRLPLPHPLLRLEELGRGHSFGKRLTKLGP